MAISTPTYDPPSTAAALAEKYVFGQQQILKAQTERADRAEKGLNELKSALSSFQTALAALTGTGRTVYAQSALFSDTSIGTATAASTAASGSYSFYVERLATASQVSYALDANSNGAAGTLAVKVGGASINIDLSAANTDGGTLSPREIAAAINGSTANTSLVTASVISTGTNSYELVLTAKNTGVANAVSIQYGGTPSAPPFASPNVVVAAQDARIRIGSAAGTPIDQPGNTFNVIDGVSMTFTKTTAAPVTLTVGTDAGKTRENVQAFVDAYNKMKAAVDGLVSPGDPSKKIAAGAFSDDSGVRALRERLVSLVRPGGANSLAVYGITANRDGTLSLDTTRLDKALALNPNGLDTLIGSSVNSPPSGLAGALDSYLKTWTNSTNGQITTRKDAVSKLQVELTGRQTVLDQQYDAAYQRYLMQFSQLQAIQSQLSSNSSMFDALFSSNKD